VPPRDLTAARVCQKSSVFILALEAPPFAPLISKKMFNAAIETV